jgi:hypothetical protein
MINDKEEFVQALLQVTAGFNEWRFVKALQNLLIQSKTGILEEEKNGLRCITQHRLMNISVLYTAMLQKPHYLDAASAADFKFLKLKSFAIGMVAEKCNNID